MNARALAPRIHLRRARALDCKRVLAWNGAPEVRALSRDPRPIELVAHVRWFATRLRDPASPIWIVEDDGVPVGVVRIDRAEGAAAGRISIVIDPAARGRGHGLAAIRAACALDGGPVLAEIHPDNQASRACFEAAGFVPAPPEAPAGPAASAPPDRFLRYQWSHP